MLTALAIKLVPVGKWLFAVCALTPMALFEAASLSTDPVLNGLSFLFIAMVLRLALSAERKLSFADMLPIFVLATLISLVKNIYFPIVALFLIIPTSYFGSLRKRLSLSAGIFILCTLAVCTWLSLVYRFTPYISTVLPMSPAGQIRFIITHPLDFVNTLVNTLKISDTAYSVSYLGVLGWLDTFLPKLLYQVQAGIIIASCLVADKSLQKPDLHLSQRLSMAGIFIIGLISIMTIEYLTCTPVGQSEIFGVQGRYLISYMPLAFLSIIPIRYAIQKYSGILGLAFILTASWILGSTSNVLLQRYY
jgi:uncharacterized membrane protein